MDSLLSVIENFVHMAPTLNEEFTPWVLEILCMVEDHCP